MIELLKKAMTAGLGLAFVTKDKIEELGREAMERGNLSEQDAKAFIDDLLKRSKETRQKVKREIEKVVRETLGKMNLATGDDLRQLEKRLERLERLAKDREDMESKV